VLQNLTAHHKGNKEKLTCSNIQPTTFRAKVSEDCSFKTVPDIFWGCILLIMFQF